LVIGVPALITMVFSLLGYIVVVPLDYQNFFNFLSTLAGEATSGPVHTLLGLISLLVVVLYYYGLFNIVKDVVRIVRGAGG
jgi:uncharacterized membrane protein (UPF0182 family)